jgi:succinoglycan biosynthesis protein ExoV
MQLYHWRGVARNFGDELDTVLWPQLLPNFFDDNPAELFLGIGSVLEVRHHATAMKLVAGAGYGGYRALPVLDANWVVHWVRGPRTARLLGLPEAVGLGDPAMLLDAPRNSSARSVGFMPHFESLARGAWVEAASAAGVTLIDPRGDPVAILAAIGNCRVLLSEAMHGVIVADALRVPWVALWPLAPVHRQKWYDWADALALRICFRQLAASSLPERLHASPLASPHRVHRLLDLAGPVLAGAGQRRFIERVAQSLAAAAAAPPQLSAAAALDRCRTRMLERLENLRRNPRRRAASVLHPRGNSAYHD